MDVESVLKPAKQIQSGLIGEVVKQLSITKHVLDVDYV
jgi:hypothetical protein